MTPMSKEEALARALRESGRVYRLEGRRVVASNTPLEDYVGMAEDERHVVAEEKVRRPSFELFVTTTFMGVDLSREGEPGPVVFETLVMVLPDSGECLSERYRTWEEAERGHARCVQVARDGSLDEAAWRLRLQAEADGR